MSKKDALDDLVGRFGIQDDVAENVIDFISNQVKQKFPFPENRIHEFLWRKHKIHDAISSIEDITSNHEHIDKSDTFIYKVSGGNWYIFNNLSKFKETINSFVPKALTSANRCRMSFEVKGQPRTGKTLCSRYVLPYFCATMINQQRAQKNLEKLSRVPVFYLMMEKNGNPLRDLYKELTDRLGEIINYQPKECKDNYDFLYELRTCIGQFFDVYFDSHMFIILDEIQIVDSKYLDTLRLTIKSSEEFQKCTFILTGSTMSMFNFTMSNTYRNGVSFFDNTISYDIPFSNSSKYVRESLKVLFNKCVVARNCITREEELVIQSYCTNLNIAYVSQILKYEHDLNISFQSSLHKLIEEIFNIYERDIIIESSFVLAILQGDLEYLEGTHFVSKENGQLVPIDKLFTIFIYNNYIISPETTAIKKPKPIDTSITMAHVQMFGERTSRYLKWKNANPEAD